MMFYIRGKLVDMVKIINPYQISRKDIERPTRDTLRNALNDITDMLNSINYNITRSAFGRNSPEYSKLLSLAATVLCNKLRSIYKLDNYIDEANSLLRDLIELIVDVFWLYHYYQKSPKNTELLSERFFMFRSKLLIENNELSIKITDDPFLRDIINTKKLSDVNQEYEQEIKNYEFYSSVLKSKKNKTNKDKNFLKKQKENWRAHPQIISATNEISWFKRCELAQISAKEIANLKEAPYHFDLKFLSGFTHWDPIQGLDYSEKIRKTLFDKNFNTALSFALDFIALTFKIREVKKAPEKFVRTKYSIHYFST